MDEMELVCVGVAFAAALVLSKRLVSAGLRHAVMDVAVVVGTVLSLYLLHLSVVREAADFLSADAGVIIVVGASGVGGLLPPDLAEE